MLSIPKRLASSAISNSLGPGYLQTRSHHHFPLTSSLSAGQVQCSTVLPAEYWLLIGEFLNRASISIANVLICRIDVKVV